MDTVVRLSEIPTYRDYDVQAILWLVLCAIVICMPCLAFLSYFFGYEVIFKQTIC